MGDIAKRVNGRVQITTDQLRTYLNVVEVLLEGRQTTHSCIKSIVPLAILITRYSPAKCIGCEMKEVSGGPDLPHAT